MPKNKNFKKRVRARMAKTGEAYSVARMHLLRQGDDAQLRLLDVGASDVLARAEREAHGRNHPEVEPEHVLLGLLHAGGEPMRLLLAAKVSVAGLRDLLDRCIPTKRPAAAGIEPQLSPDTLDVLALAADEAAERDEAQISDVVLLLAIAGSGTLAAGALADSGASARRLLDALEQGPAEAATAAGFAAAALEVLAEHLHDHDVDAVVRDVTVTTEEAFLTVMVATPRPSIIIGRRGEASDTLHAALEARFGRRVRLNVEQAKD